MTSSLRSKVLVGSAVALVAALGLAGPASAHTEADLVAVPAGHETTLTFRPTHGCDVSPTVEVAVQVPVPGATGSEVSGWTVESTDTDSATEIVWSGGSLPADQAGAFPVTFTAPDSVGELILLPAVQVCENGEEMAWIDGDPQSDYPAPRLLILSADSEPADSIDAVPADAPGRDLLTAIVDTDNPALDDPEATDEGDPDVVDTTPDSDLDSVEDDEDIVPVSVPGVDDEDATSDDDSDSSILPIVLIVVAVGVLIGIGIVVFRKNDPAGPSGDGQ